MQHCPPEGDNCRPEADDCSPEGEDCNPEGDDCHPEGEDCRPEGNDCRPEEVDCHTERKYCYAEGEDWHTKGFTSRLPFVLPGFRAMEALPGRYIKCLAFVLVTGRGNAMQLRLCHSLLRHLSRRLQVAFLQALIKAQASIIDIQYKCATQRLLNNAPLPGPKKILLINTGKGRKRKVKIGNGFSFSLTLRPLYESAYT